MTCRHLEKVDNKTCFDLLMFKMLTAASIYSAYGQGMHFSREMARFQLFFSIYIYIYLYIFVFFLIFFCVFFSTKWHWCSCGRKC